MTAVSPDHELVSAYAKEGCETAFRSLVARHVDLVYATARRQVGDAGMAEEVTQNVFVALARKAPRLAGLETLAGWLHRTALLEAKARIRTELRRRRREDTAARLAVVDQPHGEPDSPFAALVPLLDEALLHLRDMDRTALVLRFLEERSLREVGTALGVDEDAARKRVSRALDRVTIFFKQRGFCVPAGTGAAAIFANATQAAPAAVALATTQAGLAAGAAATGLNLVLLHLMSLTKTQTVIACALLVAAPLAYQQKAIAEARTTHTGSAAQLSETDVSLAALQARIDEDKDALRRAQFALVTAENRLAQLDKQRSALASNPAYKWDDQSPVVRVPKEFIKEMFRSGNLFGMKGDSGELSAAVVTALQIDVEEVAAINASTGRFLERYHSAQAATMKAVTPNAGDLGGRKPEDVRVFEVGGVPEIVASLRNELLASWRKTLGEERSDLLVQTVRNWMPLTDEYQGMASSAAVFNFDHRIRVFREFQRFATPSGETATIGWSIGRDGGQGMWGTKPVDDIPPYLRPHLADWIEEAKRSELIPLDPVP
jgi:RNA polymerase sigma factor (sigma-70 family)